LEPMPETLHLAEQIRQQTGPEQTVLERPASRSNPMQVLRSSALPMIGREAILDQLQSAWEANLVVLINGEPGVGKSRLLQEFTSGKTVQVTLGRAGDATIPFATQNRVIRRLLETNPQLELPRWVRQELSRLVPSLDETPAPGGPEARIRLFDAFAELIALTCQQVDTFLVDDLQFFDADSFEMGMHAFMRLAERGQGKRLVMAYRTGELSALMGTTLEQKINSSNAIQVHLEPLNEPVRLERAGAVLTPSAQSHGWQSVLCTRDTQILG
jgi:hypothetical protein